MYKTNMEEQDITEQIEKHREYIGSLSVEDIIERIIKAHDSTDVILEGYNLVTNVNEGHGIALAGIVRLRSAIEELLDWFDQNLTDEAEEVFEEEL
jgi:hypothetical protein